MSDAVHLVPAAVFRKWWEELTLLGQEQPDSAGIHNLLKILQVLGNPVAATGVSLQEGVRPLGSPFGPVSFRLHLLESFDWDNGATDMARAGIDAKRLIAVLVRETGIEEDGHATRLP